MTPDEVFCMTCGPAAALERDTGAPVLRCPARKLLGPIHFGNLDCPDEVLAGRLRARPSWRHSSIESAVLEQERFAAWLRAHIQPSYDTSVLTPDETADRVAAWVRQLEDCA
jgi:hypothetical protein